MQQSRSFSTQDAAPIALLFAVQPSHQDDEENAASLAELAHLLKGLGATVAEITAPFEPESGAYAGHGHEPLHMVRNAHSHAPAQPGPARIHEYGSNPDASGDDAPKP